MSQPAHKAAVHEEDAPPAGRGEEDVPKVPQISRPEPKLQGRQLVQA